MKLLPNEATSMAISMDVNVPWKLQEACMEVDLLPLWNLVDINFKANFHA